MNFQLLESKGRLIMTSQTLTTSAHSKRLASNVQCNFFIALAVWLVAVVSLSLLGITAYLPTRLLPVPVILGITIPLLFYAGSSAFRNLIQTTDIRNLTLFNLWRVPAALAFFYYGSQGLLPDTFVRNAAWGDFIAGVLAPIVVYALARGRAKLPSYIGFHLFSFADFVVAVGTGFTFSVLGDSLMSTLKEFPMALIPMFGVPVTGALSLMALHRLFVKRA
jgi:hypothetical protein